ncbi:unnamed protein product [Angiostrongylus costaricensis]|uniref:Secreted protein n=1 Tax=Angiostrongylus costaricensis TaxID=334426 RepID=A0A0R3PBZ5_ANGCS|nr:unnamed protein product [Angiostrongylus costaricensis]
MAWLGVNLISTVGVREHQTVDPGVSASSIGEMTAFRTVSNRSLFYTLLIHLLIVHEADFSYPVAEVALHSNCQVCVGSAMDEGFCDCSENDYKYEIDLIKEEVKWFTVI